MRSNQASKNYEINFDVRGIEVMRYRNKQQQSCREGNYDYSLEAFKEALKDIGCRPPYSPNNDNYSLCESQEKMKEFNKRQLLLFGGLDLRHKPCDYLAKLNYDVTEADLTETDPPFFTIKFNFKEDTMKVIQMIQAFSVEGLIGNIGGYVGLFLGYALMMIPELLQSFWNNLKRLKNLSRST